MRCTSEHHALGCNGECRSQPRPLTAGEQARIDRYMDKHHPRTYPAPVRKPTRLHVIRKPSTKLSDDMGCCEQTMTCSCDRCELQRQEVRPRSERNSDPFRRAA